MQTIDIRTTQNVSIEYELASLRDRLFAFLIDGIIIVAAYVVLLFLLTNLLEALRLNSSWLLSVIYGFLPLLLFLGYHFFSEVLSNGQTWGKKSMGLRVVRLDGQEPGLTDHLLRAVFHLVDTIFSIGILAALLITSSSKNQRLGDLTANTAVIRLRRDLRFKLDDILRINSLKDYEPQYPEVRRLSEQDMLLIKNVVTRYRTYRNDAHRQVVDELTEKVCTLLQIAVPPGDHVEFLRTLIRDYIVLTR